MILVTGGTGLVGSHLLYELAKRGEKVKALIRNKRSLAAVKKVFSFYSDQAELLFESIEWVIGDVLDMYSLNEAFMGISKVYHCAAIVSIGGKKKNDLIAANVTGTEYVVNLCLNHKIKKFCHVSSIAALGNSLNGELIDEETSWSSSKTHSAYSISKYKSEMEVWRAVQEGLNAVIVNPSVIIGPGFWNSGSGALFKKASLGMKYYTTGSTGFVDVRDVVECMIELMENEITNERFIINSENLNYKELFTKISEAIGVKAPIKEATKNILQIAGVFDSIANKIGLKKKEITRDVIKASISKSMYTNYKIKNTLGKTFISIDKSIEDTAEKLRKN
ncbi:MAG: NAD-dependent epimerase [Marinilabiliales bacterium]|nr:MAG: NAD-dependent epimerase [Marinilabiliales bacterium]